MFDHTRTAPVVSNQQLLELIFGRLWSQALVTSFKRDPADPLAPREDWNGWLAGDVLTNPHFDEGNTYFCPSLLVPGSRDRRLENFRSLHVIVIDDVPTKVPLTEVCGLLGQPTYMIETSPGNFQAGFVIEPESDLAWVKGMLVQLDQALGHRADNLTNPIAWRRLPVGFNTKAALVSTHGPKGWQIKLDPQYPGPTIRGLDWPCEIEPRIGEIARLTTTDRGIGDGARPDEAVLKADPVYRALETAGYILGEKLTSDKFWAVTVKCPWIAGHGPTRPLTGAEYVPAGPGTKGWFHCFHCERRTQAEFREQLDQVLREDGAKIVAAFDFDPVDPAAIQRYASATETAEAGDLWAEKEPPTWPGGVLPAVLEDTLAELADRDGLDLGALGAAFITAASGAADKRSLLTPYAGSQWTVPPVFWLMLIAPPGQRKTAILNYTLAYMRRRNTNLMSKHGRDLALWESLPRSARQSLPRPTVQAVLAQDTTIEKLQEWMAWNPRGLLYVRDELAGLFEFGRYGSGTGAAARASFLEFYEGGPTTIGRMTRTTTIDNCALSMIGGIQPYRLADELKGLTNDGFLSRFGTVMMQRAGSARSASSPPDTRPIDTTIDMLLGMGAGDYETDPAGEILIRDLEKMAFVLSTRPDFGFGGLAGFLAKLHGTHARAALVLHLIDGGQDRVVPADTVYRAGRFTVYLLDHAEVFYAGLAGSAEHIARAIGSYLLRYGKSRVTAGQLRRDVAACRPLKSLKEIQDAVFLLVIGGWLKPETSYQDNKAWLVRPGLENQFAARKAIEQQNVETTKEAMNHRGLYRPENE